MGKPYNLYTIETIRSLHITTLSARSYNECRRKAWKVIFKKAPELIPKLKEKPFMCIMQHYGGG